MQTQAIYQTLFWIGVLGVAAMGAMGAASHGHGGHGGHTHGTGAAHHTAGHGTTPHHAHGNTAHGTHAHTNAGHDSHGHDAAHSASAGGSAQTLAVLMGILSPMTLFSVSLGAGATGMLLAERFPPALTMWLALLGGFVLFLLVVRPLMGLARRFVSTPATTLAGVMAQEAVAQNRFDASGRGIVTVSLDGQSVRLLAFLEPDDLAGGVSVAPGEKLVVTRIDEARNQCHVTKL